MGSERRYAIHVVGVVQGVGFRPFVWRLAHREQLTGWVLNDSGGVQIEVQGESDAIGRLIEAITHNPPRLARVDAVDVSEQQPIDHSLALDFVVRESRSGTGRAEIPADIATCFACRQELFDRTNRRHGHPFVNCTDCGPRYTIVLDLPYDRAATTMAQFPLCPTCRAEYMDPSDRRFHAEPVCCPRCGPRLTLLDSIGATQTSNDPIIDAAALLRSGSIVAIKGIGGFQLAVRAADQVAARRLRTRKHREDKPFAILVADVAAARTLCHVNDDEAAALMGPAAPIVILDRIPHAAVAPAVAPERSELALLLPPTGLHHMLVHAVGEPIVLTSGNRSDEPMAIADDDAFARLAGIADAFLTHDRPIWRRADDSVVRCYATGITVLRRARGFAPTPMRLPVASPVPLLAVGAELKNTVCVVVDDQAYLSPHLGDLEHFSAFSSFREAISDLTLLLGINPEIIVTDLHPEYLSTKYANQYAGGLDLAVRTVQHHHAHFGACLAEHGSRGPALGIVFDGIGYGSDRTFWGGELLVGGLVGATRAGHLVPVPMPGGSAAIRNPWRMAVSYLGERDVRDLGVYRAHSDQWATVSALAARTDLSPLTSSVGRLFDAVAALCGLDGRGGRVSHEGQAAQLLEQAAQRSTDLGAYQFKVHLTAETTLIDHGPVIETVIQDLRKGEPIPDIARRFHRGVANMVSQAASHLCPIHGLETVVLTGGVFQNALLLEDCYNQLSAMGLEVLVHHKVPPNDGGISFGQAAIAAAIVAPESGHLRR